LQASFARILSSASVPANVLFRPLINRVPTRDLEQLALLLTGVSIGVLPFTGYAVVYALATPATTYAAGSTPQITDTGGTSAIGAAFGV